MGKFSRWPNEDIFLIFLENRIWNLIQIVSYGDNLHEMSNPIFWEKERYFKMSSSEIFLLHAKL